MCLRVSFMIMLVIVVLVVCNQHIMFVLMMLFILNLIETNISFKMFANQHAHLIILIIDVVKQTITIAVICCMNYFKSHA